MNTVYVIAGHSLKDPGASSGQFVEANLTRALREMICNFLIAADVPHKVDDDSHSLAEVVKSIRSSIDDVILDIHFNAATQQPGKPLATGVEVIVPERPSAKEKSVASALAALTSNLLGIRNRGVKTPAQTARGRLAIMQPAGTNLLLEVAFLTNPDDMKRYNDNMVALAEGIAQILTDAAK